MPLAPVFNTNFNFTLKTINFIKLVLVLKNFHHLYLIKASHLKREIFEFNEA